MTMANIKRQNYPYSPYRMPSEGETLALFGSMAGFSLPVIRRALEEALPKEKRARTKKEAARRVYKLEFTSGTWDGEAEIPRELRRDDLLLEIGLNGIALRFMPLCFKQTAECDDWEV